MKLSRLRRLWCLLTILTIPALCLGAARDAQQTTSAPTELLFLNWADYLDPELVKEFEQKFNAKVREIYYESDDVRDGMLAESEGKGYDVVLVNGAQIDAYRKQGWLAPMTPADVPNLRHIDPRWQNAYEAAPRGYAVPYFWGTLGIGYRTDLVSEKIVSWKQLYRPSEQLRGKVGMIRSQRDVIGMALKALGYSANSSDPKQLGEAEQLLKGQKPFVSDYTYIDLDEKSDLVTGKIVVSMMYNGDALAVAEYHPQIAYVVPEEGSNLWVDYLAVLDRSQNRALAMAFINFLNEPKIAARLAQFVWYATPNKAAEKLLPEEFLQDPAIYPDRTQIEKSEFYSKLPARAWKKRNRIFNEITR